MSAPERVNPAEDPAILRALEGLLYIAGEEGISVESLHPVFPDISPAALLDCLDVIAAKYDESHGIELACFAGQYKLVARPEVFPYAQKLYENIKAPAYSNAALETLAIIAYNQPITRVEIEEIRGVACETVLKKLQMRDLICADSRSDAVGKPLLYRVTDTFMDAFGLESLDELPKMEEAKEHLF